MPSLHLRGLSYAHSTAALLFDAVDLDLDVLPPSGPRWTGVVGANGAGKTTLLRLLVGELTPTGGERHLQTDRRPLLVRQDADVLTPSIRQFADTWDGHAPRLRSRLQLDPDDVVMPGRGWDTLSPGTRKRWQLGAALAEEPDVLLLDEPTNHLDGAVRDVVLGVLERFHGLGLVVSHDRTVLERLTARTLRVHHRDVEVHAGAYEEASSRWRADEEAVRSAHDRARRRAQREQRVLADVRRDRHGAEARGRRDRRLAGADQPDAREAGRKFAQAKAEAALAQRVRQMNTRHARAEQAVEDLEVTRDHRGPITFRHAPSSRPALVRVTGDVTHAGGAVWLREVDLTLHRGDRIHLAGSNGVGKTTLVTAVTAELAGTGEVVATLPQELPSNTAELAVLRAMDPAERGRVLGAAATLGIDPGRILTSDDPSPGEARKLALARLLVAEASVLVLDEPTNHLDLPSIERLGEALTAWPGACLLVTHDDRLADAVATTRWWVVDGRVEATAIGP